MVIVMKSSKSLNSVLLKLTLIAALIPCGAFAEDATKNALAKAQYMMRQVSSEKAELEKELAKKKLEVEALTKELAKAKNESKAKFESTNNQQQEALTVLANDKQKIQEKLKGESERNTKLAEENEKLTKKLEVHSSNFELCYNNNKKLYEVNKEILGKYENKGFWAALSQKEPFTSIERVKVENLVQDYQYQIELLSVKVVSEEKSF